MGAEMKRIDKIASEVFNEWMMSKDGGIIENDEIVFAIRRGIELAIERLQKDRTTIFSVDKLRQLQRELEGEE
jgi:hypothetical protein